MQGRPERRAECVWESEGLKGRWWARSSDEAGERVTPDPVE